MEIVPRRARITRPIALATRLGPDERVGQAVPRIGRGAGAEAGADDVAPVAPGLLLGRLDAVAGGIDDEVRGEAGCAEQRSERVDVFLFVVVGVALGVGGGGGDGPGVVVCNWKGFRYLVAKRV
jgi:hypothetical protein